MSNPKKILVFYAHYHDCRLSRLQEEANRKNIAFEGYNLHRDVIMTQEGLLLAKNKLLLDLSKDTVCWILSNVSVSHYFEKMYANQSTFFWPAAQTAELSDKMFTNHFFSQLGIKTPKTVLISINEDAREKGIDYIGGFPCIIKKVIGTGGGEVQVVNSMEEIKSFIQNFYQKKLEKKLAPFLRSAFIIQECLKDAAGVDYRVLCLDGKILGGIKRISQNGDFRANITLGGKAEVFSVDPQLEKICQKIINKGNLFYAGIDFIKSNNQYYAIEINTSAQFEGFEKATKINVAEKIVDKLIKKAHEKNF